MRNYFLLLIPVFVLLMAIQGCNLIPKKSNKPFDKNISACTEEADHQGWTRMTKSRIATVERCMEQRGIPDFDYREYVAQNEEG